MNNSFQLGIDMCSVKRIRHAIEHGGERFLNRIFTKAEQAYCGRKRNRYENYAARFAAKEAVIKAKKGGRGRYAFRDIEVIRGRKGEPSIYISPEARKKFGIPRDAKFELTLTHEREFAVACVAMFP